MAVSRLKLDYENSVEKIAENVEFGVNKPTSKTEAFGVNGRFAANDPRYEQNSTTTQQTSPNRSNVRQITTGHRQPIPKTDRNRNTNYNAPETVDQSFNKSYAKAGLQPSYLSDDKPFEKRDKKNPRKMSDGELAKEVIDDLKSVVPFSNSARSTLKQVIRSLEDGHIDEHELEDLLRELPPEIQGLRVIHTLFLALAYRKALRITWWTWGWGVGAWLFIQLPFAILSLVFLMVAGAIDAAGELLKASTDDSWAATALKWGVRNTVDALSWAGKTVDQAVGYLTGWNPSDLAAVVDPGAWFIACFAVVFFFSLIQLLIIYLTYTLAFLKPLSGQAASIKLIALLVAIIGYSLPVLNLFPWFFGWTLVVLLKPK